MVGTNVHVSLVCLAGSKDGAGTGERAGVLAHWAHNVTLLVPNEAKRRKKKGVEDRTKRVSHMLVIFHAASGRSLFSFVEAVFRRKGGFT